MGVRGRAVLASSPRAEAHDTPFARTPPLRRLSQPLSLSLPPPHPEIGVGLTGFGVLFTVLGVMFFFDKGLLAMGNVSSELFVCVRQPCSPHPSRRV